MISEYVENGKFDEAKNLYEQMPEKNVVAMTAMITGYCKEGNMKDARILFDEIQWKDRVSYNSMITGTLNAVTLIFTRTLHFLFGV